MAFNSYYARKWRTRFIIITIFLGFVYWHLGVLDPHGLASHTETARLELIMNTNLASDKFKPSSFDWSSVKHVHAPKTLRPLPKSKPRRLPPIQHPFRHESTKAADTRTARRDEVREAFRRSWASYRRYAWKKDALEPISAKYKDQFSGWAATLVDALDTLWIMGLREEFDEAVEEAVQIDFGASSTPRVNSFETNIRYLGGLLAAYELSGRKELLKKAVELGDLLYAGFNTKNGMPCDFISFLQAKGGEGLTVEASVVSASPGTLSMEMTRLSQLTGDPKYYDAADRLMQVFAEGQNKTLVPGTWPMYVSMASKDVVTGNKFTLGGGADSLYEYLPKMHMLMGGLDDKYRVMSELFLAATDREFLFRPMLPDGADVLMSGNLDVDEKGKITLDPESEHLVCFIGGVFGVSGRLFGRSDWVTTGEQLTNGCVWTYRSMPSGMGPERWNMVPCENRESCEWDEELWAKGKKKRPEWKAHLPKGFTTAKDPRYLLRPEAIESVFIMWRITGKEEYQEAAWAMFEAIMKGTKTPYANAAVLDVTVEKGEQEDYMESFWLAETLKYFYLVFSPPDLISLDSWVFNTEAHPLRRPI